MTAATTVFLLRHAAHDRLDRLCGRMPGVPLGALGLRQAEQLGRRLRRDAVEAVYTSPIERCRQTAASLHLPAIPEDSLTEIDFGRWTGRDFATLSADPAWQRWNAARDVAQAPDGESMPAVRARLRAGLARLVATHAGGRIALVSHADIIRTAVLDLLDLPLQAYGRFEIDPASLSALVFWPGGGKVLTLNDTAHLASETALS
jgi:broad specificity phosphatase PhoE